MYYPKISIITPSLNQGQYLEQTIQSVINQDYPNKEYIIIDGGSSDNTLEIIRKYEKHITYWISEDDRGQSHAMNKGLEKSTGELVSFVMSDDLLEDGALLKAVEIFQNSNENISLIYGKTIIFNEKGNFHFYPDFQEPDFERYLSGISFSHSSCFYKKKNIDLVGKFDERYHYGMDYEMYSRLLLVSEFKKVNDVFSKYRLHSKSKSIIHEKKFVEEWIKAFVNLINNLNLLWVENELRTLNEFDLFLTQKFTRFNFRYERKNLNEKLLLFYFLGDVLKADYRNSNFQRAKVIGKYLDKFNNFKRDNDLLLIIKRLKYFPPILINSIRNIRRKVFS